MAISGIAAHPAIAAASCGSLARRRLAPLGAAVAPVALLALLLATLLAAAGRGCLFAAWGPSQEALALRQGRAPRGAGHRWLAAAAGASSVEVVGGVSNLATTARWLMPVGTFCPFASRKMMQGNFHAEMVQIIGRSEEYSYEFAEIVRIANLGMIPEKGKCRNVGIKMRNLGQALMDVLDRMEDSEDYQQIEAYILMDLTSKKTTAPMKDIALVMLWQAECLLALADQRPPPAMPEDLDISKFPEGAAGGGGMPDLSPTLSMPFDAEQFQESANPDAPRLQGVYERLCGEHEKLISLGEGFANFDARGKEYYLDQMSQVIFKWQELFEGCERAGILPTEEYQACSETYQKNTGRPPAGYLALVEEVLEVFRDLVDQEKLEGR
mmetsp:Transcript_53775/g.136458  ORF Transcript_53775/g.136458 Transcript_53775/m.136458 type:complete len:383 (-) Transcript_53775:19-1167(-)